MNGNRVRRALRSLSIAGVVLSIGFLVLEEGLVTTVPLIVSVLLFVLSRVGETSPRARPALWLDDGAGQAVDKLSVGGRRPLSMNELLKDMVRIADAEPPPRSSIFWTTSPFGPRPPADEERENFRKELAEYEERATEWLAVIENYLETKSMVITAQALTTNESSTTADDCAVEIIWPTSFTPLQNGVPDPPDAPDPPDFPLRPGPLAEMLRGSAPRPVIPQLVTPEVPIEAPRLSDPDFERTAEGLMQTYPHSHAIRHRRTERFGVASKLLAPAGQYTVRWRIHSPALEHPIERSWTVEVHGETAGDPIETYAELRRELGLPSDGEEAD